MESETKELTVLSADELMSALTWDFEIMPGRKVICRSVNAEDAILMGVVPPAVAMSLAENGVQTLVRDRRVDPEMRAMMRDYAVASAIEPAVVPIGTVPTAGEISVAILQDSTLMAWFSQGTMRTVGVDPARVDTFRGTPAWLVRLAAPAGASVRPTASYVDTVAAADVAYTDERAPRANFSM